MLNLMRWVSPRAIKETFVPPTHFRYPFMAAGGVGRGPKSTASVLAPQRRTPMRCPGAGGSGAERSAANAAAPPGSTAMRKRRPQRALRVAGSHRRSRAATSSHVALRDGEHQLADALRRERVRGDAAGLGVDRPAGAARFRERRRGLAARRRRPRRVPRTTPRCPPMSPPPPTATSSVSRAGACRSSSRRDSCPGRAASRPDRRRGPPARPLRGPCLARRQRVGVAVAHDRPARRRTRGCARSSRARTRSGTKIVAGTPRRIAA